MPIDWSVGTPVLNGSEHAAPHNDRGHRLQSGSVARVPEEPISRRVLLLGGATVVLIGGCDDESSIIPTPPEDSQPSSPGTPKATGDERLVERAVDGARDLDAAYAALGARHPDTRRTTAPLRAHLVEHLTALGDEPASGGRTSAVRSRTRAVEAVLTAERAASAARLDDAVAAASGDLARVLASIGASHAQHALVLEGLAA